jgi:hypothetical protein
MKILSADMKQTCLRQCIAGLFLIVALIGSGCNRHSGGGATVNTKPGPEETFRRIIESFRRKVENNDVGFMVSEGGKRSRFSGHNKVTHEIIPPAGAEDRYKAIVTVASVSNYSLRSAPNSKEETERNQNSKNGGSNPLADPNDPNKKGISILEPDLAGKTTNENVEESAKSKQPSQETVTRKQDKEERKYELRYENDRWELLTKLDPKTEASIQFAFNEALSLQ